MTNVLGTLQSLQATPPTLASDIKRVWTIGTIEERRSPGVYVYDQAFDLANWPMAGFTDASGRKFRIDYQYSQVRPGHFGVLGNTGEDDLEAMQAFCDFVTTFGCANAYLHGTANLSGTLYFGRAGHTQAGVESATKVFHGSNMNFIALPNIEMDKLVHMRNCPDCYFYPRLFFRGEDEGDSYGQRNKVGVGLWLEHCRGAIFRQIHCARFWYAGVATQKLGEALNDDEVENSNNNFISIDKLLVQYVSTGDLFEPTNFSYTTNWTTPLGYPGRNTAGSAGSYDQRTTITLVNLPPETITIGGDRSALATSWDAQPTLLYIEGEPYRLMTLDRATKVATIFPWLPSTVGNSGSGAVWAWGGALVLQGADANCIRVGMLDARVAGVGLAVRSSQGPTVEVLSLQNDCGIGILIGEALTGELQGILAGNNMLVQNYYSEGPDNHILWATDLEDPRKSGQIISNMLHEWIEPNTGAESFKRLSPRESNNSYTNNTIPHWVIDEDGIKHLKKVHPSSGDFRIDTPQDVKICRSNSTTFDLDSNNLITRLFDYDRQLLLVHGTGYNGGPSGTVTFNPPGASGTINGVASSATWSGFNGPALFALYESSQDTWFVNLVAGQPDARESVVTVTADADQTLSPTAFTSRIYTAALTANRTITLPTTGIFNGHKYHITRTGAGAFNLNVGNLKNLATNTWCIVRFDGSLWKLMAYGAL